MDTGKLPGTAEELNSVIGNLGSIINQKYSVDGKNHYSLVLPDKVDNLPDESLTEEQIKTKLIENSNIKGKKPRKYKLKSSVCHVREKGIRIYYCEGEITVNYMASMMSFIIVKGPAIVFSNHHIENMTNVVAECTVILNKNPRLGTGLAMNKEFFNIMQNRDEAQKILKEMGEDNNGKELTVKTESKPRFKYNG